jgi:hypothetical protein
MGRIDKLFTGTVSVIVRCVSIFFQTIFLKYYVGCRRLLLVKTDTCVRPLGLQTDAGGDCWQVRSAFHPDLYCRM